MFGKLAALFVEVGMNDKGFTSGLGRIKAGLASVAGSVGAGMGKLAGDVAGKAGGIASSLASMAPMALVAGSAAAAVGIYKCVSAASDLSETLSKTDAVLGDASGPVKAYADTMAQKFGMVKAETLELATSFGALGKGLGGLKGEELSKFSTEITTLAADVSSFANVDLKEAGDALKIAFSGEQSDTLKRLGVIVNDTAIKNYALAHGIKAVGGELSESQKFGIRQTLIMKGLADASGDLERTQGGFANQSRKFWGTLTNAMASFGMAMMPMADTFLSALNGMASGLGALVESNGPRIAEFAAVAGQALVGIISSVVEFGRVIFEVAVGLGESVASWGIFQAAVGMLQSAFAALRIEGDTLSQKLSAAWRAWTTVAGIAGIKVYEICINIGEAIGWMVATAEQYLQWFGRNWKQVFTDAAAAAYAIVTNMATNIVGAFTALWDFLADPSGGFNFSWTPLTDGFKKTMEDLPAIAAPVFTSLQDDINNLWADMEFKADAAKAQAGQATAQAATAQAAAKKAATGDDAAKKEKVEVKFTGLADFAKEIQTSILKKDDSGKKTADNTARIADECSQLNRTMQRGMVAVAG